MVGSKENYKFDVEVKRLIIYLLGIIVSCSHMFKILHALISLISMWVLTILPGIYVISRTIHDINCLFNYVVIDGCDYAWLQTCGNTRNSYNIIMVMALVQFGSVHGTVGVVWWSNSKICTDFYWFWSIFISFHTLLFTQIEQRVHKITWFIKHTLAY